MTKSKKTLIALTAALAVSASTLSLVTFASADEGRSVVLDGTNVFYAAVDGAEVTVTRETSGEETHDFAYFLIEKDETVTFRKSLAYNWFEADEQSGSVNKTFNMEIGFKEVDFDSYTVKFQSQQYSKTKDGITENYLIFKPEGEALALYISQTDELEEDAQASCTVEYKNDAKIAISFGEYDAGSYEVLVNGEVKGKFENVSKNYSKYVSSGSAAVTPLTFSAEFDEEAEASAAAGMVMYSLNGQSFEIFGANVADDGTVTGGHILDNVAPVLCLDSNVNYFTHGGSIDAEYTVIDVVASSPRSVENYYVLTSEQYEADDIDYERTEPEDGKADLFKAISSSSTVKLLRDQYTFVPDVDADAGIVEIDGYKTYGLVKVYMTLKDVTTSNAQTTDVFLDWYVDDEYKVDIYGEDFKNNPDKSCNFIRIVEDKEGATYDKGAATLEEYKAEIERIELEYQSKIDEIIAQSEDGKLHAGSDSYFYLPDFSGYITDNLGGYTDLKYTIYYSSSSTGSNASLKYNNLSIALSEANVTYRFTIYATDAAGNSMYYPASVDEDGNVVYEELDKSKIWDKEYADLLPFFEFPVAYRSATVEDPGTQTIGYVGTTYNNASFEIEGVSGTYKTEYSLYVFDRDAYYADFDGAAELTYDDVVENADALFNNTYIEGVNTRKYFTTVRPSSSLHENDEDYETQSAYAWNASNVTFVPQSASDLYVVRLVLTDTGLTNQVTEKYMVIRASARANELYGEDNWVENNLVAIILFCVAGVCAIALVVLFIVKPKDKGDVDMIELDKPEKDKKKKSKS
ncbi:MAG: hypothetical protein ACI4MH_07590 [Candidatus Coproplasma sp.]